MINQKSLSRLSLGERFATEVDADAEPIDRFSNKMRQELGHCKSELSQMTNVENLV